MAFFCTDDCGFLRHTRVFARCAAVFLCWSALEVCLAGGAAHWRVCSIFAKPTTVGTSWLQERATLLFRSGRTVPKPVGIFGSSGPAARCLSYTELLVSLTPSSFVVLLLFG